MGEYRFYGVVTAMESMSLGLARDALLLAFEDAKLSVVEYDPETHDLRTISLHYFETADLKVSLFRGIILEKSFYIYFVLRLATLQSILVFCELILKEGVRHCLYLEGSWWLFHFLEEMLCLKNNSWTVLQILRLHFSFKPSPYFCFVLN